MNITSRIKNLAAKIREPFLPENRWSQKSFSQEGEDLALSRILDGLQSGFYIEVGSHHPFRFSNTYLFYRRGWSGICVDPLPGSKDLFVKYRPRDIVLECGVSRKCGQMTYFMFNEPALNTFNENLAKERHGVGNYFLKEKREVLTEPLSAILDRHLPRCKEITFYSIDVEGLDLEVLESNDWTKHRPRIVIAECLSTNLAQLMGDTLVTFMDSVRYSPYAKTGNSVIFMEQAALLTLLNGTCHEV